MDPFACAAGTAQFQPVIDADFDALADLRSLAMRPSLERLGRYDPERSRQRLRASFVAARTRWICLDGVRVGFYVLTDEDGALRLNHLYLHPDAQGKGLGRAVVDMAIAQARETGQVLRVTALRDSESNAFYVRCGFVRTGEEPWDIHYEYRR
ncbi:GNAT family N-acetyltransferase [Bordetella genomosp. 13]|uniref:GNAT family N-acetyltransferase n=1 Tax=Bordetella genomosp. 13 TaxID=463040 RepID=UPI0011A775AF|nr:GNAT family N-acetyltransferase [Bordetella genomosp. 13]